MIKKPYLSLVIPAYNEELNIKRGVLDMVNEYLIKQNYTWEVLIIDDGSKDETVSLVKKYIKTHMYASERKAQNKLR